MCFLFQKAFGWDGAQSGGNPSGPQGGGVGGQGAQGLVHWMSVMAEHIDPAVSHYMSWNQDVSTPKPYLSVTYLSTPQQPFLLYLLKKKKTFMQTKPL